MIEAIPDVYGEGHKLLGNREALVRIIHFLRKSHHALTIVDMYGKDRMLFKASDNYNLGVVSWMLVTNFKKTGETLEAAKYTGVMTIIKFRRVTSVNLYG